MILARLHTFLFAWMPVHAQTVSPKQPEASHDRTRTTEGDASAWGKPSIVSPVYRSSPLLLDRRV